MSSAMILIESADAAAAGSGAAAATAIADAISTGGDGGTADATNDNEGSNDATSDNTITAGAASATNSLTGAVSQTQDNTSSNTATATGGAATSASSAGGATAASSIPTGAHADANQAVVQVAAAIVTVNQGAYSNSGGNLAGNITLQGNIAWQESDADANGGDSAAIGQHAFGERGQRRGVGGFGHRHGRLAWWLGWRRHQRQHQQRQQHVELRRTASPPVLPRPATRRR